MYITSHYKTKQKGVSFFFLFFLSPFFTLKNSNDFLVKGIIVGGIWVVVFVCVCGEKGSY